MRRYAIVRGETLRALKLIAEKDLLVNTENLMKYSSEIEQYRQAGGLIRRLRTNGIITKDYKMTASFLEWIEKK